MSDGISFIFNGIGPDELAGNRAARAGVFEGRRDAGLAPLRPTSAPAVPGINRDSVNETSVDEGQRPALHDGTIRNAVGLEDAANQRGFVFGLGMALPAPLGLMMSAALNYNISSYMQSYGADVSMFDRGLGDKARSFAETQKFGAMDYMRFAPDWVDPDSVAAPWVDPDVASAAEGPSGADFSTPGGFDGVDFGYSGFGGGDFGTDGYF